MYKNLAKNSVYGIRDELFFISNPFKFTYNGNQ